MADNRCMALENHVCNGKVKRASVRTGLQCCHYCDKSDTCDWMCQNHPYKCGGFMRHVSEYIVEGAPYNKCKSKYGNREIIAINKITGEEERRWPDVRDACIDLKRSPRRASEIPRAIARGGTFAGYKWKWGKQNAQ